MCGVDREVVGRQGGGGGEEGGGGGEVGFFFNDTATTEIYTLSLHDALPILVLGNVDAEQFAAQIFQAMAVGEGASQFGGYLGAIDRDRKSTRLNSSHTDISRMPSSA